MSADEPTNAIEGTPASGEPREPVGPLPREATIHMPRSFASRNPFDAPPAKAGTAEFWILASCAECGWRCATPGEGQMWPRCPVPGCGGEVLPKRNVSDFGNSLGAVAFVMGERHALIAAFARLELHVVGDIPPRRERKGTLDALIPLEYERVVERMDGGL